MHSPSHRIRLFSGVGADIGEKPISSFETRSRIVLVQKNCFCELPLQQKRSRKINLKKVCLISHPTDDGRILILKTLKPGLCLQTFISLKARFPFPVVGNPLFQHFVLIKRSMVRAPVVLRWLSLLQSYIVVHEIVIHCRHSHPESEKYKSMCARNDQK